MAGEGAKALVRIVAAGILRRYRPLEHDAVGIALALVEAGGADQAERRCLGQMLGWRPPRTWTIADGLLVLVDTLIRHYGPWPAFVVLRIVLDQQELCRLLNDFPFLEQIYAAIELRQERVLMVDRPWRVACKHVVVGGARGMRELADGRRILVAAD